MISDGLSKLAGELPSVWRPPEKPSFFAKSPTFCTFRKILLEMKNTIVACLFILPLFGCHETAKTPPGDQLGELHLSFSANPAAMPHFEKGLKLLHNFEYDDACKEFLQAQALDSNFVMAYWGEAMTYNHPLWRQQDYEKGWTAIVKLGEKPGIRAEKAKTELERDFLHAAEILYGMGEKHQRDSAYSKQLEKMYGDYPGNEEVAAFYALSLLGAVPVGRDQAAYEKGAAIVQGILKENPQHPGALHYLIHSYDDPGHAPLALQAAHSYSEVAAGATHALHMPSHIFVAVGLWDEVVSSNIASWNASVERMKAKGLDNSDLSYHALHWLMYGYLQQGKTEEAQKIMLDMRRYVDELPSKNGRDYLLGMKGNYLVETGDWDSEIAGYDCEQKDLNVATRAIFSFLEGMKAFRAGDKNALSATIEEMASEWKSAANLVSGAGIAMCAAAKGSDNAPNQLDLDQANVLEMELRSLLAQLAGSTPDAEKWLRSATVLQESISYSYGPPPIVKPSWELYGEWLLEQNRAGEALAQFDMALQKGPNRLMALSGKLKAAKMAGDEGKATEAEKALEDIRNKAAAKPKGERII